MREKCGVFGILSNDTSQECLPMVVQGLTLLQHRGQESCGIAYEQSNNLILKKGLGLVKNTLSNCGNINTNKCIGHVRYSTSGSSKINEFDKHNECQPLYGVCHLGSFYLVHNGNIPNVGKHDTQYVIDFIQQCKAETWQEVLSELLESIPCAYCLLIITINEIFALRDRFGIRPLCIGRNHQSYCVSSESCALLHHTLLRDVRPGEIICIDSKGLNTIYQSNESVYSLCALEYIYFLRPTSICDGKSVHDVRNELGIALSNNEDLILEDHHIVIGIPDTGIISAKGYARELNIVYKQAITKNHNVQRTFIAPTETERRTLCDKKFMFIEEEIKGKNVILVDDTIVRGNVMKHIISRCWMIGANEIHIRIPAPPVINICQLGIDIPSREELLAFNKTLDEIKSELNVTSIKYLTCEELGMVIPTTCYKECFGEALNPKMFNAT